jgi:hypothetical protein
MLEEQLSDDTNYSGNTQYSVDTRVEQLTAVQNEARILFKRKNTDYGDAFANYGTIGVLVRVGDKISRLQSITSKGINLVEDEKLRDTLLDLHNYAAMGIMLLDNDTDNKCKEIALSKMSLDESTINEWTIKSEDSGNSYKRQAITNSNGDITQVCSCPSYKYSPDNNKSCKHIKTMN